MMWRDFENSIAGPTLKEGLPSTAIMPNDKLQHLPEMQLSENRIFNLLHEDFPEHCAILGEKQVRKVINYGIERAHKHRLDTEESVFWYLSLMFMLGSDFDEDEQIPWVRPLLSLPGDAVTRVLRVYDEAMRYFGRIHGENDREHIRGVLRARRQDFCKLEQRLKPDYDASMIRLLKNLQPLKCKELGEDGIIDFIHRGIRSAKLIRVTTQKGFALHTVLRFYLGEGYYNDPLYPWTGNLSDGVTANESEFVENLYNSAILFLKTVLIPYSRKK